MNAGLVMIGLLATQARRRWLCSITTGHERIMPGQGERPG